MCAILGAPTPHSLTELHCDRVSFQPPEPLSPEVHCRTPLGSLGADRRREAPLGHQGQHGHAGAQPGEAGPGLQPGYQVTQVQGPGRLLTWPAQPGMLASPPPGPWAPCWEDSWTERQRDAVPFPMAVIPPLPTCIARPAQGWPARPTSSFSPPSLSLATAILVLLHSL